MFSHRFAALLTALVTAGGLATGAPAGAAPAYQPVSGSGSTWAANAVSVWSAQMRAKGIRVDYAATGSSRGRSDFANGFTDFAVTDLTAAQAGDASSTRAGRAFPLVAGAVTFPYQVTVAGVRKTDVRLSGATLVGIFTGRISNWNDPAITADNHGHRIAPDLAIIPVVRADASATTYRLTDWFTTRYPQRWNRAAGAGPTAFFPPTGARSVAESGSDGVVAYLRQPYANGAIGYVESAYTRPAGLAVATIDNASGHFIGPDPGNVSLSLLRARFAADGTTDLHALYTAPDARSYPLAYFGYGVVPASAADPRMTPGRRQAEVDFFSYALCNGQATSRDLGYAALPLNLTRAGLAAIDAAGGVDPSVDLAATRVGRCANPTFARNSDGVVVDTLRTSVPQPPGCTRRDRDPC